MNYDELLLYVYDQKFRLLGVVDKFTSLVWADRYDESGDFELVLPYNEEFKNLLKQNYYVTTDYTDRHAIIEKIEIEKDSDDNPVMTVTGRSIDVILERRIILEKTKLEKKVWNPEKQAEEIKPINLQDGIEKLFKENLIEPKDDLRTIQYFIFKKSEDEYITKFDIKETYDKETLYEIVTGICDDKHMGFKVILDEDNNFVFSFYKGKDLSDKILFSAHYGNLNDSKYFSSMEEYRNVMVISKGDGTDPETGEETSIYLIVTNKDSMPYGLDRREVHEKSSSFRKTEEPYVSDKNLKERGLKTLNFDYKIKTGFDGEIIPGVSYRYLEDYNVGDKVMLEDEYDNTEIVYISEVVITFDENGLTIIPTFKDIDWNEEADWEV